MSRSRSQKSNAFAPPSDLPPLAKDPEGWERWWQKTIDVLYHLKLRPIPSQLSEFKKMGDSMALDESSQQFQALGHRKLVELQESIRQLSSKKAAEDDFPALWKALGQDVRKKHYFEAMKRVCSMPEMDVQRQHCPEVTWKAFEANGGQGYLDMLFLLSRERPEKEYINLENQLVNSSFGIHTPWDTKHSITQDPILFMQREFVIRRMFLISAVTRSILLSYYGHSETYVAHTPQRGSKLMAQVREGGKLHGLSDAEISRDKKNYKKIVKAHGHSMCMCCGKYDFDFGKEVKFKSCARCKAIGRETLYCSKECQVDDWKNGDPPHKVICGKSLMEATQEVAPALPKVPAKESRFSPVKDGFFRSPALQYIMNGLEDFPDIDYVFVRPKGEEGDYAVTLYNSAEQSSFRVQLNRAVTTGDPIAVQSMYETLKDVADRPGSIGAAALRKQLKREYGVDVVDK